MSLLLAGCTDLVEVFKCDIEVIHDQSRCSVLCNTIIILAKSNHMNLSSQTEVLSHLLAGEKHFCKDLVSSGSSKA